jgi:hypothetical protein
MTGGNNMDDSATILSMENSELEPVEAKPLPLSAANENPPLVVDLPEGQKLVVGNLDPGIVIEVATWRGTGRPDSRTSRFMLGVSTNEDEGLPKTRSLPPVVQQSIEAPEVKNQQNQIDVSSERINTGVVYSNLNPTQPRNDLSWADDSKDSKKVWLKRTLIAFGSSLAIAAVAAVLFGFLGLRFAHPMSGVNTSTGAANTGIVLIKPTESYEVGENVIADVFASSENPVMSVVAAVNESAILLATENGYSQVKPDRIRGQVVVLFPYFGKVANLFN